MHQLFLAGVVVVVAGLLGPVAPATADVLPPTRASALAVSTAHVRSAAWHVSPQITAPHAFGVVGVTFTTDHRAGPGGRERPAPEVEGHEPAGGGAEIAVQVRTAAADGGWSAWIELPHAHDEGPDPGSPEAVGGHATHPLFVGRSERLQVRSAAAADVVVHVVDTFGYSETWGDRVAAAWRGDTSTTTTAAQPPIVTREGWGADESLRRDDPSYARRVERAFVHHTVGSNSYTPAEAPAVVRAIYAYHVNGRGWDDLGYNFLVDRYGTIYEGRYGGIDQAVIGAQAGGFNAGSTGVALMGTFSSAPPPDAARQALVRLLAWKLEIHNVHPQRAGVAVSAGSSRYPPGTEVSLPNLTGHRDVSTTDCPGGGTYALLDALRGEVRAAQGALVSTPRADVPEATVYGGDPAVDEITFSAELDPPGSWSFEVYDPQGELIERQTGEGAVAQATWQLQGDGFAAGFYDYVFAADGRRSAGDHVELLRPVIQAPSAPAEVALDGDGAPRAAVRFSAQLWPDAAWQVVVTEATGAVAWTAQGTSASVDVSWDPPVMEPGTYHWMLTADEAVPVTGTLDAAYQVFQRLGDSVHPTVASALLSGATFPAGSARHVVLARADVFADALAGGPLAGADGPLLLTPSDTVDPVVADELGRVLPAGRTIYVLGGPAAISEDVVASLQHRWEVVRLAGPSRVDTAAAVARMVAAVHGPTDVVMVARAGPDNVAPWADALAGGAYGARTGTPVLLTSSEQLSAPVAQVIAELGVDRAVVLGGRAAVADAVVDALPGGRRVAGDDRTATAVAIAEQLWGDDHDGVVLANGFQAGAWAWALAASPLAARGGAPLLLTGAEQLAPATAGWLRSSGHDAGVAAGTAGLLPAQVLTDASAALVG